MNLFINDKPTRIVDLHDSLLADTSYDVVFNAEHGTLKASLLQGNVLAFNASEALFARLFQLLRDKKLKKLQSITFAVANKKEVVRRIKANFRIIKAAGGLVTKDGKVLMMQRMGKWDLPKGKLEKGEKARQAAVREVEEECNVAVSLDHKIGATWHTYAQNGNRILKKTKWYAMTCLNDADMRPQVEESIEQLVWMNPEEIQVALYTSYASIRHVFETFYAMQKTKTE